MYIYIGKLITKPIYGVVQSIPMTTMTTMNHQTSCFIVILVTGFPCPCTRCNHVSAINIYNLLQLNIHNMKNNSIYITKKITIYIN